MFCPYLEAKVSKRIVEIFHIHTAYLCSLVRLCPHLEAEVSKHVVEILHIHTAALPDTPVLEVLVVDDQGQASGLCRHVVHL